MVSIVWFRHDLRLADNPALHTAAQKGPVLPVYILDPALRPYGGASFWALTQALRNLGQHIPLLTLAGDPKEILPKLCTLTGATHVFWNHAYTHAEHTRDTTLKQTLTHMGITSQSFQTFLLVEPWQVKPASGPFYKVFTPFWKSCLQHLSHTPPLPPLPVPKATYTLVKSHPFPTLPQVQSPSWAAGFGAYWPMTESAALKACNTFLSTHLADYAPLRDEPAKQATSRLSPYLRFGCISPKQVYTAALHAYEAAPKTPALTHSFERFLAELGWREFSYHLLYHIPTMPHTPLKEAFNFFEWNNAPSHLSAWQKGLTGYPIIDAGMRQLWHTGWMHNRVRMLTASFLVKNLLIPWQEGEAWFWDTLVDADPASNTASWQWVAGCGADAAPYFRIFNPITQSQKFDPAGAYLRQWLPALKNLPAPHIHAPFEAPSNILKAASITLGVDYPQPIINHKHTREEALTRYKNLPRP